MAVMDTLAKRYLYCSYGNCNRSNWNYWGRYVVAGVVVFVAIVAALACA